MVTTHLFAPQLSEYFVLEVNSPYASLSTKSKCTVNEAYSAGQSEKVTKGRQLEYSPERSTADIGSLRLNFFWLVHKKRHATLRGGRGAFCYGVRLGEGEL